MRRRPKYSILKKSKLAQSSRVFDQVINPGVTIGENALIGSGSVVTRNMPDKAIAFGNHARVVNRKVPLQVTSTRPRNTKGSL